MQKCPSCKKLKNPEKDLSEHLLKNPNCFYGLYDEIKNDSTSRTKTFFCPYCKNKPKKMKKRKNKDKILSTFSSLFQFEQHLRQNHSDEDSVENLIKYYDMPKSKKIKTVKEVKSKNGIDKICINSKLSVYKNAAKAYAEDANPLAEKESLNMLQESDVEKFIKVYQREPKKGSIIKNT